MKKKGSKNASESAKSAESERRRLTEKLAAYQVREMRALATSDTDGVVRIHDTTATIDELRARAQTAALLPQFTFGLSYGSTATSLDTLFSDALGPTVSVGGGFVQTLLDGGATWQRRKAAVAAWDQAKSQYRSTVLDRKSVV